MIHPSTELRLVTSDVGFGVYATALIPRGTITWVLDSLDLVLPDERVRAMSAAYKPILDRYCFRDANDNHVMCWDFGRYVNHACDPTTVCLGALCDIAARDIQPGEQLTCEYAFLNMEESFECRCGSPICRGRIGASIGRDAAAAVDRAVAALLPELQRVRQPLLEFMSKEHRARLHAITQGHESVPSCMENARG